jgi:hypothetical protein
MTTSNQKLSPVILINGITGARLISKQTVYPLQPPPISREEEKYPIWLNLLMSSIPARPIPEKKEEIDSNPETVSLRTLGWSLPDYTIANSQPLPIYPAPWWKTQMTLKSDGITAEKDDYNRHVDGFKAIEKIVPDIQADFDSDTGKDNRYFAALIEALEQKGYVKEDNERGNLVAAPYDWRVSPEGLKRAKYDYFNQLKNKIQKQREDSQRPVTIIAHSMGNRVTQYFLKWVQKELGEQWIDKNIERYIAVSPPWLGGPLSIRLLSSDDPTVLGKIAIMGLKQVVQSYSSVPWTLPVAKAPEAFLNTEHFAFVKEVETEESATIDQFQPKTIEEILIAGGAEETTLRYQRDYYQNDELIGSILDQNGNKLVECPPVQKLDVIYAYGTPTHVGAYYYSFGEVKDGKKTKSLRVAENLNDEGENFIVRNGVRLEIEGKTLQLIDRSNHSGDGVVPYGSLTYHKYWQKNESLKTEIGDYGFKLDDADTFPGHEEILKVDQGINKILELLGF